MRKLSIIILSIITLFAFPMLYSQASKYEGKMVKKIFFEGLKNTNEDDLLYVMKTTVGYPLKALEIREDIKKIFKKGNFESVVVEIKEYMDGVRLKFVCKERPVVREIKFKGLDQVSESVFDNGNSYQGRGNDPEGFSRKKRERHQKEIRQRGPVQCSDPV